MKSILEEFANGNIDPQTQYFRRDSEYAKTLDRVCDCERQLLESLSKNDQELLKQFVDAQGDLNQRTATDNFIYGYKLGVSMTAEVFMRTE